MKKKWLIYFSSLFLGLSVLPVHAQTMFSTTENVSISSGSKSATYISIDLSDPELHISTAVSKQLLGTAASLEEIAADSKKEGQQTAAINGNFFDAYLGTNLPYGILLSEGNVLHKEYDETICAGFDAQKNFYMGTMPLHVTVEIQKASGSHKSFPVMGVNHDMDGYANLYTPLYGEQTPNHSMYTIVAENGIVSAIHAGPAPIPKNGFAIVAQNIIDFTKGDSLTIVYNLNDSPITTAFAGGPILVKDGEIPNSFEQPGSDASFLTKRALRSFIGITEDNRCLIAVVRNATIAENAETAKKLGCKNAFNMDGGASAGLSLNGETIVKPGRAIPSAVIFTAP